MDYDVVKASIQSAYRNFGYNDGEFYSAMDDFFKEGKKNPSVARILLQDYTSQRMQAAGNLLNDTASINFMDTSALLYPEDIACQRMLYNAATSNALKSIQACDMYNSTKYNEYTNENRKDFDRIWTENYPRTGKIRERIIEANRIKADGVTPKVGWLEKINFAKTLSEYKKDYPKSFYARYMLIFNEQIKENDITPKVKGWFRRFTYKRLIKQGFCFKK